MLDSEPKHDPLLDEAHSFQFPSETPPSQRDDIEKSLNEAEPIHDGKGLRIRNKTLYHGSPVPGIDSMNPAEEDTIGHGIYFTPDQPSAAGYARLRAKTMKGEPVVYEAFVEQADMLDLRNQETLQEILKGYREILISKIAELQSSEKPHLRWAWIGALERSIESIDTGRITIGNIKQVTQSNTKLFTGYLRSLGYQGIIALEGGEGDIGNHESYVLFDASSFHLTKQEIV